MEPSGTTGATAAETGALVVSPTYVVTRPDDHVLLAVHFAGFTLTAPVSLGDPATVVAGNLAYLGVIHPPQAIFEQRLLDATAWPAGALLGLGQGGPSTIEIPAPAGTVVVLTVEDILAAVSSGPFAVRPGPPTPSLALRSTALALPAGLFLAPVPLNPAESVSAEHPTAPRRNGDTTALWQSEIGARSGVLALPLGTFPAFQSGQGTVPDDDTTLAPLSDDDCQTIVNNVQTFPTTLPHVERLRLSALGATFTAGVAWDDGTSWDHDMAVGRDRRVHTVHRGVLLPFGHTAILDEVAERRIEDAEDGADTGVAPMRTRVTLTILPIRDFTRDDSAQARAFPFDRVEVLTPVLDDLDVLTLTGNPGRATVTRDHGVPVPIAVRLYGPQGPVDVTTQMIYQSLDTPSTTAGLRPLDDPVVDISVPPIDVPAARIDLVRAASTSAADVHLVHQITMAAGRVTDAVSYWPQIASLHVDLPAVRRLLPPGVNSMVDAKLSQDLINRGAQATYVLDEVKTITGLGTEVPNLAVTFDKAVASSGALVSPAMVADAVARDYGPMAKGLLDAAMGSIPLPDPSALLGDAKLLGLRLSDLLPKPLPEDFPLPKIVEAARDAQQIASGTPPTVEMSWTGLKPIGKNSLLAGVAGFDTTLTLDAKIGPDSSAVTCTLTNFAMALPNKDSHLLTVSFATLVFAAVQGSPPVLKATGVNVGFGGALNLIQELAAAVDFGHAPAGAADAADDLGQIVKVTADGITLSYAVSVAEVPTAAGFDLRNIDFRSQLTVPFNGDPVSFATNFATRDNPFTLTVLAFGGGGYVNLLVDGRGLQHFEGSLDFGAQLAVNFFVAAGEVHAFGGVTFDISRNPKGDDTDISVSAFLRFGGSLKILDLVTVSVELSIDLTYDGHVLSGSATLVIDVDISIWSDSVELDTGTWVIAGHEPPAIHALDDADLRMAWQQYREAFPA